MLNSEVKLALFLAIYPEDSRILGSCRGEPIYAREHVHTVSSKADPVPGTIIMCIVLWPLPNHPSCLCLWTKSLFWTGKLKSPAMSHVPPYFKVCFILYFQLHTRETWLKDGRVVKVGWLYILSTFNLLNPPLVLITVQLKTGICRVCMKYCY